MTIKQLANRVYLDIKEGRYTKTNHVDLVIDDSNILSHVKNSMIYLWFKQNGDEQLLENIFKVVLIPEEVPDLKAYSFEELLNVVSPETVRILK